MDDQESSNGQGGAPTPTPAPTTGADGRMDSVLKIDDALRRLARLLAHADDLVQPCRDTDGKPGESA